MQKYTSCWSCDGLGCARCPSPERFTRETLDAQVKITPPVRPISVPSQYDWTNSYLAMVSEDIRAAAPHILRAMSGPRAG
jgi:hypothetical protein